MRNELVFEERKRTALLEEKVLYRTLKGSKALHLEPLKCSACE